MKKTLFSLLTFCLVLHLNAQSTQNEKLIEFGKAYKNFMFRNEPPKEVINDLKKEVPENLIPVQEFIVEAIKTDNKLLTKKHLSRPDDSTLKLVFIIQRIDDNLRNENPVDNNLLIDSLAAKNIPTYELLDCYYGMLVTCVGNKNQPFNLSKTDIRLNEYNLKDDTEKGILFLRVMDLCGTVIWGYMNIPKPPNTEKAYGNIKKYPKFNGQPYYQYSDFYFPDFEMVIVEKDGMQSYKSYYINKYYQTLMYHYTCLKKEDGSEKELNDLLLGSILKEKNLYKYSKYKYLLEDLFKEQKRD